MRRVKGASLLTTLVWISLVSTLGLTLAGLSVQHLFAVGADARGQQALNAARSVVALAIGRLMKDQTFGQKDSLLHVQFEQSESEGMLCFDSSEAQRLGIPASLNNIDGTQPKLGWMDKAVPRGTVHLIGVGRSGGISKRVEAWLTMPAFPFAMAAAGQIRAYGGVTVGGLAEMPETARAISDSELIPADLLSNNGQNEAVFLGANTRVKGDVRCLGGVVLDPNAPQGSIQVDGLIRSGGEREYIPQIRLQEYDPRELERDFRELDDVRFNESTPLSGVARRQGNLECNNGLKLDGGILYVDGDLQVQGGLTGKGLVVATGKVLLEGQSQLETGSGLALLADGDVEIRGSGKQGSYFRGMVYTNGGFSADKVSIVGPLVAGGADRTVALRESRLILPPPDEEFEVGEEPPDGGGPPPPPAPPPAPPSSSSEEILETTDRQIVWVPGPGGLVDEKPPIESTARFLRIDPETVRLDVVAKDSGALLYSATAKQSDLPLEETNRIVQELSKGVNEVGLGRSGYHTLTDEDIVYLADRAVKLAHGHPPSPTPSETPAATPSPTPTPGTGSNGRPVKTVVITTDPSQFYKIQDRIRVTLWREDV